MSIVTGAGDQHTIVVVNPKGGCGKTTLATNLASYYALRGPPPTLVDCDPQGFCMRWLEQRPSDRPPIQGVEAYGDLVDAPAALEPKVQPDSRVVIFDLPAAIPQESLHAYTYIADSLLIPITPSEIDVHSATRFIAELLLDVQLDRREQKLAIVANRVRSNTKSYQRLMRFLASLKIPMIAALRDTQNYVHASAHGIGIWEMPVYRVKNDIAQMNGILTWLNQWQARRLHEEIAMEFEQLAGAEDLTLTDYESLD